MTPLQRKPIRPHGLATLGVVMLLLVSSSLFMLFVSRNLVFEQRSAANQSRAIRALAAAESGLAWAQARLNDPRPIDAQCRADTSANTSFRARFAALDARLAVTPDPLRRAACRLGEQAMVCACDGSRLPSAVEGGPGFQIELAAVDAEPRALRLTVHGCSDAGPPCVGGAGGAGAGGQRVASAQTTVQVIVQQVAPWRRLPAATVTAGGTVGVLAGARVLNADAATRGLVIDAGGAVHIEGLHGTQHGLRSLPGSPIEAALIENDTALQTSAMDQPARAFEQRFGMTLAQFRASPWVRNLGACGPSACAEALAAASRAGYQAFLIEGDLQLPALPGGTAGSDASRPALIVATGRLQARPGSRWFGWIHAQGSGQLDAMALQGAVSSEGDLHLGATVELRYAPDVLERLRAQLGRYAPLPGSWRDGRCNHEDALQPCRLAL